MRRLLLALGVGAAALVVIASAPAATPRVLALEFENDVNPVTQDYLVGEMRRAERDGTRRS